MQPGSPGNRGRYNNPELIELLDRAAAETDREARKALYMEAQELVAKDPPFFTLFWRMSSIVTAKGVGGFELPSDAFYDLRYMYWQLED